MASNFLDCTLRGRTNSGDCTQEDVIPGNVQSRVRRRFPGIVDPGAGNFKDRPSRRRLHRKLTHCVMIPCSLVDSEQLAYTPTLPIKFLVSPMM